MQTEGQISRQSREINRTVDEESATDKRESCEIPREAIGGQSERTEGGGGGNNCACCQLEEARGIPLYPP